MYLNEDLVYLTPLNLKFAYFFSKVCIKVCNLENKIIFKLKYDLKQQVLSSLRDYRYTHIAVL